MVKKAGGFSAKGGLVVIGEDGFISSVRELPSGDMSKLLNLCLGNPQYYRPLGYAPTIDSLSDELAELPPGCSPKQKQCLGYYSDSGELIAVLDVVRGYPDMASVFIGFFMVDAAYQGIGLGRGIISRLCHSLRLEGYHRVRLGYVDGNAQSQGFWARCGFSPSGETVNCGTYQVVPMEKPL